MIASGHRAWLLALLVAAIWWGSAYRAQPHRVLGADAPATDFSAQRARTLLARVLGPRQRPHPLSSDANSAARGRILAELAAIGVPTQTLQTFTCNAWRGFGYVPCATVTDIVAQVLPGAGPAILMVAHYDSVPAGPGAADDGSGVAALLEAARALRAGMALRQGAPAAAHPVLALLTDGEEPGLLGAHAFLADGAWRARVGVVVNLDARGTSGSSLLFQTSAGDAPLIRLYATHVPEVATSSLYAEVYRRLPNDTDFTLFLREGFPGFNFAFADDERYYHSPRDSLAALNLATLQMQGDSLLGVVRGLEQVALGTLRGGRDAVYLSVLNAVVVRLPAVWVLPLGIVVFLAIALAGWLERWPGEGAGRRWRVSCMLLGPALVIAGIAVAWALAMLAQRLAGTPDAGYAHPAPLGIGLGCGIWGVLLLLSRGRGVHAVALGVWLWMAGLGVLCALLLPGFSPYFVLPALVAALALLVTARRRDGWSGRAGQWALLGGAAAALIVWVGLAQTVGTLLGIGAAVLAAAVFALGLTTLLPLLATPADTTRWRLRAAALSGVAALLGALLAGVLPAYSVASPERVNLIYLQEAAGARWVADSSWNRSTPAPLPQALRAAGPFRLSTLQQPLLALHTGYVAPALDASYPLPAVTVTVGAARGALRAVTLQWRGSARADAMLLYIPAAAGLQAIEFRGQRLQAPAGWHGATRLLCESRDCQRATLTLQLAAAAFDLQRSRASWQLQLAEQRFVLPTFSLILQAARPSTVMSTQNGDQTVLLRAVALN